MSSAESDRSPGQIAAALSEKPLAILRVLAQSEQGKLATNRVTDRTGLSNQLVNYHYKRLLGGGLIEEVEGEHGDNRGIPAKVYRVTKHGQDVAMAAADGPRGPDEVKLGEIEDRLDRIDERLSEVSTAARAHGVQIEDYGERLDTLHTRVEGVESSRHGDEDNRIDGTTSGEVDDRIDELETKLEFVVDKILALEEQRDGDR